MTTVTEVQARFRANVKDLDKRFEAERLWRVGQDAWIKFVEACDENEVDCWDHEDVAGHAELAALKSQYDEANKPWLDFSGYDEPLYPEESDGLDEPHRCALTGLLIHDGDWVLEDENTGERVLKCALGVAINEAGEFDLPAAKSVEAA